MEDLNITQHAYDRAKERLGWKSSVVERMSVKAIMEGLNHSDLKGSLKRYVDKIWLQSKLINNIKIYGEVAFLFKGKTLITLYRIENKLIKHLKNQRK